jgi:hypothetical protein
MDVIQPEETTNRKRKVPDLVTNDRRLTIREMAEHV